MTVTMCPAVVTIIDYATGEEFECRGKYYGDGRVKCVHNDTTLMVDPEWFYPKDPKRMFAYGESRWTSFRVKSILLDSKAILKNW